jgi:hypothetical protein
MTTIKKHPITTRDLMPKGYLKVLKERTGYSPTVISTAVRLEDIDSPVWSAVLKLARETQQKRLRAQAELTMLKQAV